MNYFVNIKYDALTAFVVSAAIASDIGKNLYLTPPHKPKIQSDYIDTEVWPKIYNSPIRPLALFQTEWRQIIYSFFENDPEPSCFFNCLKTSSLFCNIIHNDAGLYNIPFIKLTIIRAELYPSELDSPCPGNAMWDALALKNALLG